MEKVGVAISAFIMVLLVIVIAAIPTMLAWDVVMPKYFGLKEITFWDAIMLNVLASCLFKSSNSKEN